MSTGWWWDDEERPDVESREWLVDEWEHDDEEAGDEIEQAIQECGQDGRGVRACALAGTEWCMFHCLFRHEDLTL